LERQGKTKGNKKLISFSNHGLLILTPSNAKPCSVCAPDAMCPEGPTLFCKSKYRDVAF